jgi:hypothetical protein
MGVEFWDGRVVELFVDGYRLDVPCMRYAMGFSL